MEAFIVGWDGFGNPMGIDEKGRLVKEDHNFGGIHEVAASFDAFLQDNLLGESET